MQKGQESELLMPPLACDFGGRALMMRGLSFSEDCFRLKIRFDPVLVIDEAVICCFFDF